MILFYSVIFKANTEENPFTDVSCIILKIFPYITDSGFTPAV